MDLAAQDPTSVGLSAVQGSFTVQDPWTHGVTFLDTDGTVLRTWTPDSSEFSMSSDDETGIVVQAGDRTFSLGPRADAELPGWPVQLAVDDGSGPAQLVLADDDLVALGAGGERLWSLRSTAYYGLSVVLDGVLYLATTQTGEPSTLTATADGTTYSTSPGVVRAVDARTGAVRWSRSVDQMPVQLSTDGRSLVGATGSGLVLWSLKDGTPVRELRPPDGISAVSMVGSLVVGYATGDTVVVLGTP